LGARWGGVGAKPDGNWDVDVGADGTAVDEVIASAYRAGRQGRKGQDILDELCCHTLGGIVIMRVRRCGCGGARKL